MCKPCAKAESEPVLLWVCFMCVCGCHESMCVTVEKAEDASLVWKQKVRLYVFVGVFLCVFVGHGSMCVYVEKAASALWKEKVSLLVCCVCIYVICVYTSVHVYAQKRTVCRSRTSPKLYRLT
jgi:hypothetical protein